MNKLKALLGDKTLMRYSTFIVFTATLLYILYFIIKNFNFIAIKAGGILGSILGALTPLFIGIIIAYLLSPLTEIVDSKVMKHLFRKEWKDPKKASKQAKTRKVLSVVITFLIILAIIVLIIYGFAMLIVGQVALKGPDGVTQAIIDYFKSNEGVIKGWVSSLPSGMLSEKVNEIINMALDWFTKSFSTTGVIAGITGVIGNIANLVIGLIISLYILLDKDFFLRLSGRIFKAFVPGAAQEPLRETLSEINGVVSMFLRGVLLDALFVGILSSIALSILGLDFAVFIGCFAGLANVIPYFGPLLGMIPAFAVGFFSEGLTHGLLAIVLLFAVQQIDCNLIYPKIVGSSTGLHPLFVLLAVTIAGHYGGIVGMILGVPAASIIKIFFVKALRKMEERSDKKADGRAEIRQD